MKPSFWSITAVLSFFFFSCNKQPESISTTQDAFSDFDSKVEAIVQEIKPLEIPKDTIDLIEFSGYSPDREGSHDFYKAINAAIQALAAKGGGTLHFRHTAPPEQWVKLTETYRVKGPIMMESNIELLFDHATRLFFEFEPAAYLPGGKGVIRRYEGTTIYSYCPLIYAFDKQNIKMSKTEGNGALPVIDGDGEDWVAWSRKIREAMEFKDTMAFYDFVREANNKDTPLRERVFIDPKKHPYRPTMMEFLFCENVDISGLKLKNAPFWVVHPVFSKNMKFHHLIFDCQNVNNDGFDPESSDNILIEHIIFDNHDDNVVAKAGRDVEGRKGVDVTGTELENFDSPYIKNNRLGGPVTDVVFRHSTIQGHYAFAAGSEMSGGVDGIYMYNCTAPVKVKSGLFIKSSRRRGGYVKNVYVRDIKINESDMALTIIPNYDGDTTSSFPPNFSDIFVKNVRVNKTKHSVRVFGWGDAITKNVLFKDINIKASQTGLIYNYVEGLKMENVEINGEAYEGTLQKSEKNMLPPEQT